MLRQESEGYDDHGSNSGPYLHSFFVVVEYAKYYAHHMSMFLVSQVSKPLKILIMQNICSKRERRNMPV